MAPHKFLTLSRPHLGRELLLTGVFDGSILINKVAIPSVYRDRSVLQGLPLWGLLIFYTAVAILLIVDTRAEHELSRGWNCYPIPWGSTPPRSTPQGLSVQDGLFGFGLSKIFLNSIIHNSSPIIHSSIRHSGDRDAVNAEVLAVRVGAVAETECKCRAVECARKIDCL